MTSMSPSSSPPTVLLQKPKPPSSTPCHVAFPTSSPPPRHPLRSPTRHHYRTTHLTHRPPLSPFGSDAIDVAGELNLSPYIFFPSAAMLLSFALFLPRLDQEVQCEYTDLSEPIQFPGCVPVHVNDMQDSFLDRKSDAYKWLLHHTTRYTLAEGIIESSFSDFEPKTIELLQKNEPGRPPVYPVGPLVNEDCTRTREDGVVDRCLNWLDEQPCGSVMFVCFGSGGTLSSAQIVELALGLEMSEQRFLWVVKSPNDDVANASFLSAESCVDPFDFLPKGFVDRTKEKGLVVPSWAPQAQVLSHGSVGGFLTHCGWNSILESVVNGVPLVAWPLYAEQRMNAVLVTEEVKVALRPRVGENGLVIEREEIACIVKNLIEGEEGKKLQNRMKDLKVPAARALGENGSSTNQIEQLALKWQGKTTVTK